MQVEIIKPNSLIKLEFSVGYYQRLQNLITHYTSAVTPEELTEIYKRLQSEVELTEWEAGLQTLLVLIQSVESLAREQKLTEFVEVPDQVPNSA